jgi:U4/U6.U5 small nuclear ribonucleoproteins
LKNILQTSETNWCVTGGADASGDAGDDDEEADMMKLMGFADFNTTKVSPFLALALVTKAAVEKVKFVNALV